MNRTTRNAIATAIKHHTGNGKTREDYSAILKHQWAFGYATFQKVTDEYNLDMTIKNNAYSLLNTATGEEVDHYLVISEYFGNPQATANGTHEITAYVS